MPRMLADKKRTLWLLESLPADPGAPTAEEINGGQVASCSVGNAGFELGAGSPNTVNDGSQCEGESAETPTNKTYNASMNVFRFYDPETGQIAVSEDFLYQAMKEFGSELIFAFRDGGKAHTEDAEDGDEISIYKCTAGGMGRATDTQGWQKRVAHVTVQDAWEDKWVGGTPPVAGGGGGG